MRVFSAVIWTAVLCTWLTSCADTDSPPSTPNPDEPVAVSPPVPAYGPVPRIQQLEWQRKELYMFVHFGVNTFTGNEWGDGTEDPQIFNPVNMQAEQWVDVARETGFKGMILTAKHLDGFALWPSAFSDYSVAKSPWRNGTGDVVGDVAKACHLRGMLFGVYLSPWDRHEPSYGTSAYNDFYTNQLTELLTKYGPVFEVWLDGAHGSGVTPKYDTERYYQIIRRYQPDALIANYGPDVRWVGNEIGVAPDTLWSADGNERWYPAECDVSIRPGWFWHSSETPMVRTGENLLDLYFMSVGRNSVLLLNVPPTSEGVLDDADVASLREFYRRRQEIFSTNHARNVQTTASNVRENRKEWSAQCAVDDNPETFWATDEGVSSGVLELAFPREITCNVIDLREAIRYGQRVESFRVEALVGGQWRVVGSGATIGYRRLLRIEPVRTTRIRCVVESAKAAPLISDIGVYTDPQRL